MHQLYASNKNTHTQTDKQHEQKQKHKNKTGKQMRTKAIIIIKNKVWIINIKSKLC